MMLTKGQEVTTVLEERGKSNHEPSQTNAICDFHQVFWHGVDTWREKETVPAWNDLVRE